MAESLTFLEREQPDICVFGHTHQPRAEWFGKTLLFNPGSAGPRRFKLPRAVGILDIDARTIEPRHIVLSEKLERNGTGEKSGKGSAGITSGGDIIPRCL